MKPRRVWVLVDAAVFVYLTAVGFTYWTDRRASAWCLFSGMLALANLRRELLRGT